MKKSQLLNFFRVVFLLLIFSAFSSIAWAESIPANTTLYLDAGEWNKGGAGFAAYFFDNGDEWVSMTHVSGNIFKVTSPNKSFPKVIFARMNSANATGWGNRWNQTKDITDYTSGKNLCTITSHWDNNNASWTWSTYSGDSGSGGNDEGGSGSNDDTGECKTLYLKPNVSDWSKGDERYVAYFFKNDVGHTWVNMEKSSTCSDIYKVAVPDIDLTNVIFVRMNGGSVINSWGTKWDQTVDLTFAGANNLFTINHKDGDKWKGSWSSNSCTDKAVCYTCNVSGSDDIYSDVKISSSNVKEIFKETFTFTENEMKNLSTDDKDKFRKKYSVSNEKYSASIPSYDAMTTPCSAIKDGGYYAMLVNPKYAGWGDQPNGVKDCNINGHRWYRSTTDGEITEHTGDTNGGMLLFNCKNGTEDKCMPDILYECIVNDICQNTYINFSAYVACANTAIVGGNISISAEFRLLNPDDNDKILAVKNIKDLKIEDE